MSLGNFSPNQLLIARSQRLLAYPGSRWPAIAVCLAFLMTASIVQAQLIPIVIEALPESASRGAVFNQDINERGQVVGLSATADWGHAISWTLDGGIVDLGAVPAAPILMRVM